MRAIKILLLLVVALLAAGIAVVGVLLVYAGLSGQATWGAPVMGLLALASGGSLGYFCLQALRLQVFGNQGEGAPKG